MSLHDTAAWQMCSTYVASPVAEVRYAFGDYKAIRKPSIWRDTEIRDIPPLEQKEILNRALGRDRSSSPSARWCCTMGKATYIVGPSSCAGGLCAPSHRAKVVKIGSRARASSGGWSRDRDAGNRPRHAHILGHKASGIAFNG